MTALPLAAPAVLTPVASSVSHTKRKKATVCNQRGNGNVLFFSVSAFLGKTSRGSGSVVARALGHLAQQRRDDDPYVPYHQQQPQPQQHEHAPGSNVWHEVPPPASNVVTTPAQPATASRNGETQYINANGQASSPASFANPNTPSYLYEIESARVRYIELEAKAVQERDYLTASKAATHIERLIEMEAELLNHDTAEMEASLKQDYATALTNKNAKERLLSEFEDIQNDLYGTSSGGNGRGGEDAASSSDGAAEKKKRDALHAVPVRFTVNAQTNFGETVVVCGDIAELGLWDPSSAPEMSWIERKKAWGVTLQVPKGSNFKFKFVIGVEKEGHHQRDHHHHHDDKDDRTKDEGGGDGATSEAAGAGAKTKQKEEEERVIERDWYWQEGTNRAIQMPLDEVISMDISVDWAGDTEKEKMWLCMPVPFEPKGE